ncbi:MAG: EcsC family protein [Bacteroidia bacterium]|nr:EcsC family protein [Bacteroidia bacterium]MDW8302149.1 EcsC family protein [Bacteroidia bacterium]
MAKLNQSEQKILDEINAWKAESPSFLSKVSATLVKPITWAGNQLIPDEVQNKIAEVVQNIIEKLQVASNWTVNEKSILQDIQQYAPDIQTVKDIKKANIQDLDTVSILYIKSNKLVSAVQGLGTGLAGWLGLLADLPAFFLISMRLIHQVSICYGYSKEGDNSTFETNYMLHVFKVGTASSQTEKQKSLSMLKDLETEFYQEQEPSQDPLIKHVTKKIVIGISTNLVQEIVMQILRRKAITMLPGVGALINSGFNYLYMQDIGTASYMLYRERFLRDKSGRGKIITIKIDG